MPIQMLKDVKLLANFFVIFDLDCLDLMRYFDEEFSSLVSFFIPDDDRTRMTIHMGCADIPQ